MALDDIALQIFNDAVALHQSGQLEQAKVAYREILNRIAITLSRSNSLG